MAKALHRGTHLFIQDSGVGKETTDGSAIDPGRQHYQTRGEITAPLQNNNMIDKGITGEMLGLVQNLHVVHVSTSLDCLMSFD